jgi:hypothetical protein
MSNLCSVNYALKKNNYEKRRSSRNYIYICIWRERLYLKEIMDDLHSDTQSAYQAMVYIVT